MAEQNAYQLTDWKMAKAGALVANQARLDAMLAVFGQAAIEAAAPAMGERVLDVGCSPGGRIWLWIPRQRGALLSLIL